MAIMVKYVSFDYGTAGVHVNSVSKAIIMVAASTIILLPAIILDYIMMYSDAHAPEHRYPISVP